ncbi:peptide-methionine (S)-S-oxide reductase [Sulfurovum sp.]|uniref:peptide-methionine (S)-S-oxide reductase n=1 Tax=Sulfurovum sp. TaxID=1969726 RepID=UPI0025D355E5|nr:peptide-methionine (S)-S-oxide reductase [Sulfurovum sp.]
MQKVGFGGGCHWCTEAVFASLRGVSLVEQGWIASRLYEAQTPSEAVIVTFDPKVISLDTLIEIHLYTHNATSSHVFRDKYRSAVYVFDEHQQKEAEEILQKKQKLFKKPLVTRVYPFGSFTKNKEKYLNYYHKDPCKPFCQVHIAPKLKVLFERYKDYARVR